MPRKPPPPEPTDRELRETLSGSYAAFQTFLQRNPALRPEWKYYGNKLGWTLKLFDRKRNLCFLSPHPGHLMVGFVLGGRAVQAALDSELPEHVKRELREGRVYVEGTPVRLHVSTERDLEPAQILLAIKQAN